MCLRAVLLAAATGLCLANVPRAQADVVYTVFNPFAAPSPFTLFIYDSPTFITTDTTVDVAQLAFANPANTITSVEFKPSSSGVSELDVFQSGGGADQTFNGDQFRYYPRGTFDQYRCHRRHRQRFQRSQLRHAELDAQRRGARAQHVRNSCRRTGRLARSALEGEREELTGGLAGHHLGRERPLCSEARCRVSARGDHEHSAEVRSITEKLGAQAERQTSLPFP